MLLLIGNTLHMIMNNINQYYEILSVDSSASLETVKQAYRTLAKIWHPDYCINDPKLKAQSEIEIKKINQAYTAIKSYLEFKPNLSNKIDANNQSQVSIKENTSDFYYFQGISYAEQQNYEDALISFAQAIKLDSDYIKAYQYRGFILSELGYEYRATVEFDKVKEIKNKRNKSYYYNKNKVQNPVNNKTQKKAQIIRCCKSISASKKPITSIVVSSDNKTFLSISKGNRIKLWNINTGKNTAIFKENNDKINSLVINTRGTVVISAGRDKKIKFWDLKTQRIIKTFGGYFSKYKETVSLFLNPDNKILLSYNADGTIQTWDINRNKIVKSITLSGYFEHLDIARNCKIFCTTALTFPLQIRNIENGKIIRSINHDSDIICTAFSPDSNQLATGGFDRLIMLWDINTGNKIHTLTGHLGRVSSIAFSSDGENLISGDWNGTIKVWQLKTGKEIISIKAHSSKIKTITIASNNQTLFTGDEEGNIKIWRCYL